MKYFVVGRAAPEHEVYDHRNRDHILQADDSQERRKTSRHTEAWEHQNGTLQISILMNARTKGFSAEQCTVTR